MALFATGCGAKTGVRIPDAGPDAGLLGDASIPCIELLPDSGPIEVPLSTEPRLQAADVFFLVDTTASMNEEIERIQSRLRDTIAPAIQRQIPDVQFGVAEFEDFAVEPYGSEDAGDVPFTLRLPMTSDLARVQAAVNALDLGNGRDEPESHVEALYQVATGEGLPGFVQPSFGCPSGGFGYPCFRNDSLAVVLLFSDAPMHNGPGRSLPYTNVFPTPHRYDEAAGELATRGIRVIGFESSADASGLADLQRIARDTGALDASGRPLVFEIGPFGDELDTRVVGAMQNLGEAVVFDVDAVLFDPVPGDGVDVRDFIDRIDPLRAEPMEGIAGIDLDRGVFLGVQAGTRVVFQLTVRNDAVVPGPTAQRFRLVIVFRGDGRTRLGETEIEIVIPGADGLGCQEN